MKKSFIIFLLSNTLFVTVSFSQNFPKELIGTWKGKVVEAGRSDWYDVNLTLDNPTDDKIAGTIDYPDYKCGGKLEFVTINHNELTEVMFNERLTYGKDDCIDNGKVVVAIEKGRLKFQWSKYGLDYSADGYLDKR